MSETTDKLPARLGGVADEAVADLAGLVGETEKAARAWGVRPDHLEGRFVSALLGIVTWLARLVVAAAADLKAVTRAGQKLAETELATLKAANELAANTVRQARAAQTNIEVQRETLVARMVENIGPQLAGGVKDWLVLREREHNRKMARRRAAITSAVVVALVAGGYGLRAWQDTDATAALSRCVSTKIVSPTNGEAFCSLNTLLPE
jgi:hypothetical protein